MSGAQLASLGAAAVLWATISASIGGVAYEEKSDLGVFQFSCGPRTHPGLLFNDPRIDGTGWVRQGSCSGFLHVARGPLPGRSDYDLRYGMAMTCNDLLFFVPDRFPTRSRVEVTLRSSGGELSAVGDVRGSATIHVPEDPMKLAGLVGAATDAAELHVQLRQEANVVRGSFQLNDLSAALAVLRDECP